MTLKKIIFQITAYFLLNGTSELSFYRKPLCFSERSWTTGDSLEQIPDSYLVLHNVSVNSSRELNIRLCIFW